MSAQATPDAAASTACRPGMPASAARDAEPPRLESLPDLYAQLDGAEWDVRALAPRLPALTRRAGGLAPEHRSAWLAGLHRAWTRQGWAMADNARLALLELAALWGDWPLARAVAQPLAAARKLDAHGSLLLARALHRLGESAPALEHLALGMIAHPRDARFAAAYRSVCRDAAYPAPALEGADLGDADLRLVPLGHQHQDDFAWQYHDPAIAELCCLPRFEDGDHWHGWLDAVRGYGDQIVYALLHREWGFAGCVSLVLRDGLGFFYYWLGRDFQGHGLGPRGGALLLAHAERHWALRACYARVYASNARSRRGLEKLGFVRLALPIDGDRAPECLYRRGEPLAGRGAVADEARALFAAMGSRVRVCFPVLPAGVAHPEAWAACKESRHVPG